MPGERRDFQNTEPSAIILAEDVIDHAKAQQAAAPVDERGSIPG